MKNSIEQAIKALKKIATQNDSNLSEISIRIKKVETINNNTYPPGLSIIEWKFKMETKFGDDSIY